MTSKIQIFSEDRALADRVFACLLNADLKAEVMTDTDQGLQQIDQHQSRLVIIDITLPQMEDFQLLSEIKNRDADIPILILCHYGFVSSAVSAIRNGADDYLLAPFEEAELLTKVKNLFRKDASRRSQEFVAIDAASVALLQMAKKVAASDATVMISGESGTGKEVLARFIHHHSNRSTGPFVAVNCAAIPETMLEATLFGYEKGAFTGAVQTHEGKFEQAQKGTLLLDEISEMDLSLQAKLLRVIQEKEVERLGSKKTVPLNVRIIATTNRDLQSEVVQGRFREDLFYRLNVFPLRWMPLRHRKNDIIPMAHYLLRRHAREMSVEIPKLSLAATEMILQYPWPGNVREMDNIMQRLVILHAGQDINAQDLPLDLSEVVASGESRDLKSAEYEMILETLLGVNGNRTLASEQLGISTRTLRNKMAKMRELGMAIPPVVRS